MTIRPLDHVSPIPLYYQLAEILKEEIESECWLPGETISSEAELSATHGISRTVIRNALDILEGDGQVYRVKGKGTVVAEPKVWHEAVDAAAGFAKGARSEQPVLSKVVEARTVLAGGRIGGLLGVSPDASVFHVTCLHSVGGAPASSSQLFLRHDASGTLKRRLEAGLEPELEIGGPELMAQLAARYRIQIATSEVIVEATRANEFESGLLDIPISAPVFLAATVDRRRNGLPVAFTRRISRGDTFRFAVRIRGPGTAAQNNGSVAKRKRKRNG